MVLAIAERGWTGPSIILRDETTVNLNSQTSYT